MTTVNRRYNDGEAEKLKAAGRRGMTAASRRDDGNKPKGRGQQAEGKRAASRESITTVNRKS